MAHKTTYRTNTATKRGNLEQRNEFGALKYSKQEIAMALKINRGFKSHAAKSLGCTTKTINEYIARYPDILRVIEQAKEAALDDVEAVMFDEIAAGNWKAAQFYLSTQGKKRGYGTETEKNVSTTYNLKLPDNFPVPSLAALTTQPESIDVTAQEVE